MAMKFRHPPAADERLKKLAQSIEALARKDEERLRREREIAALRQTAAGELHALLLEFVAALNRMLSSLTVDLSPAEYHAAGFRDPGVNMFQINVSGRLVQIAFEATDTPTSTEKFRQPYFLEGAVRCFDQELLELVAIHEVLLFCCLEKGRGAWLLLDPRTQRSAPFDLDHLTSFVEMLV